MTEDNAFDATSHIKSVKPMQCAFDIIVFCDIGIMEFAHGKYLQVVRGAKGDLKNSFLYRRICKIKEDGGPQLTGLPWDADDFYRRHGDED